MTAEKGNKVYTIDQGQKALYQTAGFDIRDDDGNLIEYGAEKTVSYNEYTKLLKENEDLKKQISALEEAKEGPAEEEQAKATRRKAGQ